VTKQGIEMVALCGPQADHHRHPKKKEVREKMFVEKYEAKSKIVPAGSPQSRDDRISFDAWQSPSR